MKRLDVRRRALGGKNERAGAGNQRVEVENPPPQVARLRLKVERETTDFRERARDAP